MKTFKQFTDEFDQEYNEFILPALGMGAAALGGYMYNRYKNGQQQQTNSDPNVARLMQAITTKWPSTSPADRAKMMAQFGVQYQQQGPNKWSNFQMPANTGADTQRGQMAAGFSGSGPIGNQQQFGFMNPSTGTP